jgi:hypothetical protein
LDISVNALTNWLQQMLICFADEGVEQIGSASMSEPSRGLSGV